MKIKTTLLIIALVMAYCFTFATTCYVDNTVSTSGNGTIASPWKNISDIKNILPGDTILFKRGRTWNSALTPVSGATGIYVTYGAYGTGIKPKLAGFIAEGKSYVKVQELEFNSSTSNGAVLTNAHHITMDGCNIYTSATDWAPALSIATNSHHHQILNCDIALTTPSMNDAVNLRGNADYNLFQGNTIRVCGQHGAFSLEGASGGSLGGTANFNIIKNNRLISTGGSLLQILSNSDWNLIEENIFSGCGSDYAYARHEVTFKVVTKFNIVRKNILKGNTCRDGLGLLLEAYSYVYSYGTINNIPTNNHVYNNVITGIYPGGTALFIGTNGSAGLSVYNNYFKNNAFFNNGGTYYQTDLDGRWPTYTANAQMHVTTESAVYNNYFTNNLFYKSNATSIVWVNGFSLQTINHVQSANPTLYKGNIQEAPTLDANFKPLIGSPTIDAGVELATITSASGSGTSFVVTDPLYFTDGMGIISGDTIRIGSQTAVIMAINYNTKVLTLDRTVSWTQGGGVSLSYLGAAPDIGVYEYARIPAQ